MWKFFVLVYQVSRPPLAIRPAFCPKDLLNMEACSL